MNSHFKDEDFRKKYKLLKQLSARFVSVVYLAESIKNKELRTIKIINLQTIRECLLSKFLEKEIEEKLKNYIKELMKEIDIMKKCEKNNENSVKYYESFETKNEFVIVMEYYDENLSKFINVKFIKEQKFFNSKEIYEFLKQLNNTFKIMKENKIVHLDLKPENIVIKYINNNKNDFIIKLFGYYGLSLLDLDKEEAGYGPYMAPEILKDPEKLRKCHNFYRGDLWSLGIIIYKLFFGNTPYKGFKEKSILKSIEELGKKVIKETGDENLDDLINKLLERDPNKRITLDEYFNHPFFNILNNKHFKDDYKNKYKTIKKIGVGNNTDVYLAENLQNKEKRAIKIIKLEDIRLQLENSEEGNELLKSIINNLKNEIKNMEIIGNNHENSVKYYESFETENEFAIVMEYCEENLLKFRNDKKDKRLNSKEIFEILIQLNHTFKKMKENKIVHRDLKPNNILIKYKDKDKNGFIVKLCDYGTSKLEEKTKLKSHAGTEGYMAPEIIKIIEGEYYDDECDLWSLGIIIYELFFGERPYKGFNEVAILERIEELGKKAIKNTKDEKLDDLIDKLLEKDPHKRITWENYFNHPFFKNQ